MTTVTTDRPREAAGVSNGEERPPDWELGDALRLVFQFDRPSLPLRFVLRLERAGAAAARAQELGAKVVLDDLAKQLEANPETNRCKSLQQQVAEERAAAARAGKQLRTARARRELLLAEAGAGLAQALEDVDRAIAGAEVEQAGAERRASTLAGLLATSRAKLVEQVRHNRARANRAVAADLQARIRELSATLLERCDPLLSELLAAIMAANGAVSEYLGGDVDVVLASVGIAAAPYMAAPSAPLPPPLKPAVIPDSRCPGKAIVMEPSERADRAPIAFSEPDAEEPAHVTAPVGAQADALIAQARAAARTAGAAPMGASDPDAEQEGDTDRWEDDGGSAGQQAEQVAAFVAEKCEVGLGLLVATEAFRHALEEWCAAKGFEPPSEVALGKLLRQTVEGLEVGRTRNGDGERHRIYKGIALKPDASTASSEEASST